MVYIIRNATILENSLKNNRMCCNIWSIDPESLLTMRNGRAFFLEKMKPFQSFDNQVSILKSRKLIVKSDVELKNILKTDNYYRLSGYFKLFTEPQSDDFKSGFSFKTLLKIYNFDFELRILLSRYLSSAEINSRTRIAYLFSQVASPDGYLNPNNFWDLSRHRDFVNKIREEIAKNSRDPIVQHFTNLEESIPIWALVEIMTFGVISKMFKNLKSNIQNTICRSSEYKRRYSVSEYSNYLQATTILRNICAHHGRLYGKMFPFNVCLSRNDRHIFSKYGYSMPFNSSSTLFFLIFALTKLIENDLMVKKLIKDLKHLFSKYRSYINLNNLGFYKNWNLVLLNC